MERPDYWFRSVLVTSEKDNKGLPSGWESANVLHTDVVVADANAVNAVILERWSCLPPLLISYGDLLSPVHNATGDDDMKTVEDDGGIACPWCSRFSGNSVPEWTWKDKINLTKNRVIAKPKYKLSTQEKKQKLHSLSAGVVVR